MVYLKINCLLSAYHTALASLLRLVELPAVKFLKAVTNFIAMKLSKQVHFLSISLK
jgi:hypothetical protein